MQTPIKAAVVHPVTTYRWTGSWKPTGEAHRNLSVSVTCAPEDPRHRRMSWNGAATRGDDDDDCDYPRRPKTSRAHSMVASPTRVRFIYEDEDAKARVCGNVERLLNVVQKDPEAMTTNARVARKVLKYRRVMGRLDDVNVEDPDFDASAFFGIEWCRVGAPSS
ncbi:hypothetical protein PHYSODRAFT_304103 [Phytophthora sojae]|uniref:Uncharacterized protein n=1 Tax=Phytophthora sojae (strain P6497) TaxID=1094619 RepID=G4ZX14_PHYSP|nr:hypothetical protein PHYSODRAFT_304103 [Phytophthora sojae]EGZ12484.1 hypothetical protein PHYSODRAFT_304103 [Phytophthora sojae]|eukprot:XP_009532817.1 hypothetical protein PHYSODRAFT_304103 [Phytophthora sojae]